MQLFLPAKSAAPVAPRLVVEHLDKRKRIIAGSHDGSHLGLNRTNDMVSSKYYWPGHFTDVRQYVSYCYQCKCKRYDHLRWNLVTAVNVKRSSINLLVYSIQFQWNLRFFTRWECI